MQRIGIMQGRLSPRPPGKLQAFPWQSWQAEFDHAAELGFDQIEWIYELAAAADNPVMSAAGRAQIRAAMSASGVQVRSICADYFMERRLAGDGEAVRGNVETLCSLIAAAGELGAERILLPLLETAAVNTETLEREVVDSLRRAAPVAATHGVVLGLEMEIPGERYADLIERVGHPAVRAYYDTGNSTAQGFDIAEDVRPLLPLLHAVHVKDRKRHGTSMPLGKGDTNFLGFFRALAAHGFKGDLVLQHYFDTAPILSARDGLAAVRGLLSRARGSA